MDIRTRIFSLMHRNQLPGGRKGLLWLVPFFAAFSAGQAQEMEYGEAEYLLTCAECHGAYGLGDGNLARQLGISPADLTGLQAQNDGEFPYWRVFSIIDGRHSMPDEAVGAMPSFGAQFSERDEEEYGAEVGGALTERRIHALTRYVESLQLQD